MLVNVLTPRLQYFEDMVVESVSLLGELKETDVKKVLFVNLATSFIATVQQYENKIVFPYEVNSQFHVFSEISRYDDIEFHHNVKIDSMFDAKIPGIVTDLTEESFFEPKLQQILDQITKILQKSRAVFTNVFFTSISPSLTEYDCNPLLYIATLYLLKRTNRTKNISEKAFAAIVNKIIFNPYITMYEKPENFEQLAFLRQIAVETIFLKMKNYTSKLLSMLKDYPYLFAEICLRIESIDHNIISFEEEAFQAIYFVEQKLRTIYNLDPENAVKTIQARDSIFVLIFCILNNTSAVTSCFSSQSFAYSFMTAFFEDSFSDIVFMKLTQVFRTVGSAITQTVGFVANTLKILSMHNDSERTTKLASRLLNCVFEGIQMNPDIITSCDLILTTAIEYANAVPSFDLLTQILQLSMQQFVFNPGFIFDTKSVSMFASLVRKCEGTNVSELTKNRLLSFLSASQTVTTSFLTLIKKPSILLLIFAVYTNGKLFDELFRLMVNLLNFSMYNSIKFHEGEIDILLLDMIYNFPESFNFRGCVINNLTDKEDVIKYIYPVLSKIIVVKSSTVVAQKIMSIILPTKGLFHPLAESFMTHLFSTVLNLNRSPSIAYPMAIPKIICESKGYKCIDFFNESSVVFWLKIDPALASQLSQRIIIFDGFIQNIKLCEIYMIQTTLFVDLHLSDRISSFKLYDLPSYEWNCIAIAFRTQETNRGLQFKLTSRLNTDCPVSSNVREPIDLPEEMTLFFGNPNEMAFNEIDKAICAYQVHNLTVYSKVIDTEISSDFVVAGTSSLPMNYPILMTTKQNSPNQICQTKVYIDESEYRDSFPNILDIYKKYIALETFLPVFSYLDKVSLAYGPNCVNFIMYFFGEKAVNLLELIPYYLSESPPNILTVNLYNTFYGMLEILTEKHDIEVLVEKILLNADLWSRSSSSVLHKIVSQWCSALCEMMIQNKIVTNKILSNLFLMFRRNFYLEPVEKRIIQTIDRDKCLDLNMIHSLLIKLISNITMSDEKSKFNDEVINEFILQCIYCEDYVLAQRMYSILPILIATKPSMKVARMCHYINPNIQKSFVLTYLQSIQMFYPQNLYKESFLWESHIPAILDYNDIFSENFELDITSCFPLIFMIIIRADIQTQQEFLGRIAMMITNPEIMNSFISKQCWFIWFILLVTQVDPMLHFTACDIFAKILIHENNMNNIEHVIMLLDIMRVTTKLPVTKIKCLLCKTICESPNIRKEDMAYLIGFCFMSIFIRLKSCNYSEKLLQQALESGFKDDWIPLNPPQPIANIHTFSQIRQSFTLPNQSIKYWLYMADWDKLSHSQQYVLEILHHMLEKTPLITPILHVISLIARYPKGASHKKRLIMNIVSEKEFLTVESLIQEKMKRLVKFQTMTLDILDKQDKKLAKLNSTFPNLDPAKTKIDKMLDDDAKIRNVIIRNQNMYMNEDSIWSIPQKSIMTRDNKFLSNFDSIFVKRKFCIKKALEPSAAVEIPANATVFIGKRIKPAKICIVKFYIEKKYIHIVFDMKKETIIPPKNVRAIFLRDRFHQETALEIFTSNGKSFLIDFAPNKVTPIINQIKEIKFNQNAIIQTENGMESAKVYNLLGRWYSGSLSNYEFLLLLNMFAGRSFNDISHYPIFPWVETYFKSASLRNLTFPITYQSTKVRTSAVSNPHAVMMQAPNNPSFVCSMFSRIEPFASQNLSLSTSFIDTRQRSPVSFPSVHAIFERINTYNENREAFPEVYSVPEVFLNGSNTLATPNIEIITATPIRVSASSSSVHDDKSHDDSCDESSMSITIPDDEFSEERIGSIGSPHVILKSSESWTKVTMDIPENEKPDEKQRKVFEWVYQSRKILNSPSLSQSLGKWVDLVFGVAQSGKDSVKTMNIYDPSLLYDVWEKSDPKDHSKLMEMIEKNGTLPAPVFNEHVHFVMYSSTSPDIEYVVTMKISNQPAVAADFKFDEKGNISLLISFDNNTIEKYSISLDEKFSKLSQKVYDCNISKIYTVDDNLLIFDKKSNKIVNQISEVVYSDTTNKIEHFCSDGKTAVVCTEQGIVTRIVDNELQKEIHAFCERITCIAVSSFFGITVVAFSDGKVLIYDNEKSKVMKSANVGQVIYKTVIAQTTGLILCKTQHEIFVISINGTVIKSAPFDRWSYSCCTWKDANTGVDIVASSDLQGNIFVFEAFFPQKPLFAAACGARPLCMKYNQQLLGLCILTEKSQFLFYPFS